MKTICTIDEVGPCPTAYLAVESALPTHVKLTIHENFEATIAVSVQELITAIKACDTNG